jgi:hypothetical protein
MNNPVINLSSLAPRGAHVAREYLFKKDLRGLRNTAVALSIMALVIGLGLGYLMFGRFSPSDPQMIFSQPYRVTFDSPVSQKDIETCQADSNCMDVDTTWVAP